MEPKRIAVFVPTLGGGGAERVMLNLAGGFAEAGHHVDFVVADSSGPLRTEVPPGVRLVDLNTRRIIWSLPRLAGYLRRVRPDAMLSALDYANVVAIVAKNLVFRGLRLVVSERSTFSRVSRSELTWIGRMARSMVRYVYPYADGIVAPSEGSAEDLRRSCGVEVQVILNPVLDERFAERARAPLNHPWMQETDIPVFVTAGRLTEVKDHITLIKAFRQVRNRHRARLIILGEGAMRAELEALIRSLDLADDVALPGFVANPLPFMRDAQVYVLSSRREGLPSALIEALALGTRVVSTDCESGPREVLEEGRYGTLVPVGDVNALAKGMQEALGTPEPRPDAAWHEAYSKDQVVNRYLGVLLEESC